MHENINEIKSERIKYAESELNKLGIQFERHGQKITFQYKGENVYFFPFTGWHAGKTITDGRGIKKLIKQIIN